METSGNFHFMLIIGALILIIIGYSIGRNTAIVSVLKTDVEKIGRNSVKTDIKKETPQEPDKPEEKKKTDNTTKE